MRIIQVAEITEQVKEMCIEANYFLSPDMRQSIADAVNTEETETGKYILGKL